MPSSARPVLVLCAGIILLLAPSGAGAEPPPPISHYGLSYGRHADLDLVGGAIPDGGYD
ncbi:hypothetical protein H8E07_11510 [bacterium]|nr:hypothetical protein [bacterium]